MTRHQSLWRAHADTSDENFSWCPAQHKEYHVDVPHNAHSPYRSRDRSHTSNVGHRDCHPHVSSDSGEPHNINITATQYCIDTTGESTISYHDCREYTAYSSHQPWSSYQDFSSERHRDLNRGESHSLDEDRRGHPSYVHAKHSQPDELEPVCKNGYSGKSRSYGSDKYRGGNYQSQEKPNNSSSRHEKQQRDIRINSRRHEHSRSNRYDPNGECRDQSFHYEGSYPSHSRKPKTTPRDDHFSEFKNSHNHKSTKNVKPSQGKPDNSSSRGQDKSYSNRSEIRHGGMRRETPRSTNRKDSSHRVSQPEAREYLPNYYATLEIDHLATADEIKIAAKRRRVEVHPDRLKRIGMSDSESAKIDSVAAMVGQAAEVLQNPEMKREHDRTFRAAQRLQTAQ